MPKTVCHSIAWFKRYKTLKSVTVGRSVGSLNLRKFSYSAKTRSAFGLARNKTILNCSHFFARRYFFNPFSPKRSMHTGKLPQQHEFANASFVILVRCHFVSPYHVNGSSSNVPCRGGHFCEIAGVLAHWISSQVAWTGEQLELCQTLSQNIMAWRVKTFREEGMILKRRLTGRTPTVTTDEKRRILKLSVQ